MRVGLFISMLLLLKVHLFAQGEIDDQIKSSVRNEKTYHAMLMSNGFGAGASYAKVKSAFKKQLFNIELSYIKDPKELRISNPYYPESRRFVFGKMNQFYNLRIGYGMQKQLFSKQDKGGIEIRWFYLLGANLSILKPVYYEIKNTDGIRIERFNRSNHLTYQDIYGGASFFKGFNELGFMPGIHARIGTSFEFGKQTLSINALEGGLTLDLFPKKLELMANDLNQFSFFGFFIGFRFGQVVNPRTKNIKQNSDQK